MPEMSFNPTLLISSKGSLLQANKDALKLLRARNLKELQSAESKEDCRKWICDLANDPHCTQCTSLYEPLHNYEIHRSLLLNGQTILVLHRLTTSRTFLVDFINACPYPMCVCDLDGKYVSSNIAHLEMFNVKNVPPDIVRSYSLFDDPLLRKHGLQSELKKVLCGETVSMKEIWYNPRDFIPEWPDTPICLSSVCFPMPDIDGTGGKIVIVYQDITYYKNLEKETSKLKTVDSLGKITGGVAHDFSNYLTTILGNLHLLATRTLDQEAREIITTTETSARRLASLNRQLLTIAKGETLQKSRVTINNLITDTIQFWMKGSRINVDFDLPENIWTVEADVDQLSQVLQNIALNAKDAMGEQGKLSVRAWNVTQEESEGIATIQNKGAYVAIAIKDDGPGILPENLPLIFDALFTTKKSGHGIGLTYARSIIDRHLGYIEVSSQVGAGVEFVVYLPAMPFVAHPIEIDYAKNYKGFGSILLVDDDEAILSTTGAMLDYLGYHVVQARSGEEAIGLYHMHFNRPGRVEIVIMDFNLKGGINGCQTVNEVLKINPQARVIFSSGVAEPEIINNFKQFGFCEFLSKPYSMQKLSRVLHEIVYAIEGS